MKSIFKQIKWPKLIASIILCQLAGVIGAIFTTPAIGSWYNLLNKPSFAPPGWLIGIIWIILYTLMGISLYIIWNKYKPKYKLALSLFGLQLFLNTLWSILFFGLRSPVLGFIWILDLWLAILATKVAFYKISKNAAYLLLPYLIWVTIAAILNYYILILN